MLNKDFSMKYNKQLSHIKFLIYKLNNTYLTNQVFMENLTYYYFYNKSCIIGVETSFLLERLYADATWITPPINHIFNTEWTTLSVFISFVPFSASFIDVCIVDPPLPGEPHITLPINDYGKSWFMLK